MKTTRKYNGVFSVTSRSITAETKFGRCELTCKTKKVTTPLGRPYSIGPVWYLKLQGLCAAGPFKAQHLRELYQVKRINKVIYEL